MDWGAWGPPLVVFVAAAAVALVVLRRMQANEGAAQIASESRRIDLESTRDEVLEALKALELEKDKLPADEYRRERERLLARGARAMEALDTGEDQGRRASGAAAAPPAQAVPAPVPMAPPPSGGLAPEWKGALYALLAVGILAILWRMATDNSAPRGEGGSMTGSMPGEQQQAPMQDPRESPQFKEREAALIQKLEANPNDLAALNEATWLYITHGDPGKGMEFNDRALKIDAEDPDAKTARAVITAMMGMFDKAIASLDAVIEQHEMHPKAVTYRALILLQMAKDAPTEEDRLAKAALAVEGLKLAKHLQPGNRVLNEALQEAQSIVGGGGAAPAGHLIASGTVAIDPAAQATLKGTETLFVNVSDPMRPGPPVAADKVAGPLTFPLAFELTRDDIRAMPGATTEVPERMDLKVRVDLDGNAMTREPGTPCAVLSGVARGTSGIPVTLTLDCSASAAPGAAPPAPAAAGDVLASGTAKVDPSVVLTGSETVFVSVKDPAGGPPLASKKLMATFPLEFTITSADLIAMGGARPIPAAFNVAVRIDKDGNAMTKDGPEVVATGVSKGATGLDLLLK